MDAQVYRRGRFDGLRALMLLLHFAVIAYVCLGGQAESRIGLFAYVLLLPAIIMQWCLNWGTSIVSNIESLIRHGRWNDPDNPFEGRLFQALFALFGINLTQAQITVMVILTMMNFWIVAMFRMVLIH
jgi:hypothetical protein